MSNDQRDVIVDAMRDRVLRGIQAGTLEPGDRLPGSREIAAEFDADYRAAIAAYKSLQAEGLVELRPRGGVYIAPRKSGPGGTPPISEAWVADIFSAALNRGIAAPELLELLPRCVETLRLRSVVIAETDDQVATISVSSPRVSSPPPHGAPLPLPWRYDVPTCSSRSRRTPIG
jgi:DNA-binding transcriptional regulator YhcF (GntR family)